MQQTSQALTQVAIVQRTTLSETEAAQLRQLLETCYVESGFTELAVAGHLFTPQSVLSRGKLYLATLGGQIVGCVVYVDSSAPGKRFAVAREAELHLLAVAPALRGSGLGALLVNVMLEAARKADCERVLLWTQGPMLAAQRVYARCGFERVHDRDFERDGKPFLFMQCVL